MYKKIFIFIVLGIALFWVSPVFANDILIVEFEKTPLFNEANFLPGQGVTRWVKVINNSGQTQRIAAEAIKVSDPDWLGVVLNLEIKKGGTTLYSKPLSTFFKEGEVFLSSLANSSTATYDFAVTFYSGAQNTFQGKSLSFDIIVGFQGEEGGILPGAGGGGGGYLPLGLTIQEESVKITVTETSVTIEWTTSYPATSQVIYAKDGESHTLCLTQTEGCALGAPPKYGYERTTLEDPLKDTSHKITITGLDSGTKYYYRAISHASLAISTEHSFTTLGASIGEKEPSYAPEGATEGKEDEEREETVGGLERPELVEVGFKESAGLGKFLAAIGAFPFNLKVILIIVALILIVLVILWLFKKRKK